MRQSRGRGREFLAVTYFLWNLELHPARILSTHLLDSAAMYACTLRVYHAKSVSSATTIRPRAPWCARACKAEVHIEGSSATADSTCHGWHTGGAQYDAFVTGARAAAPRPRRRGHHPWAPERQHPGRPPGRASRRCSRAARRPARAARRPARRLGCRLRRRTPRHMERVHARWWAAASADGPWPACRAPVTGRRGEATRRDGHLHASRCKLRGAERGAPRTRWPPAAAVARESILSTCDVSGNRRPSVTIHWPSLAIKGHQWPSEVITMAWGR